LAPLEHPVREDADERSEGGLGRSPQTSRGCDEAAGDAGPEHRPLERVADALDRLLDAGERLLDKLLPYLRARLGALLPTRLFRARRRLFRRSLVLDLVSCTRRHRSPPCGFGSKRATTRRQRRVGPRLRPDG